MIPVHIAGISKSYDGRTRVLEGVDLTVAAGELFFLLGGSGCGKTTLLRLVAGFLTPDAGRIRFGDEDVTALPAEKRGIGMVFQNYALWPHLDVGGNVAFGLEVQGVATAERGRRTAEALEQVGLTGLERRRIGELSGGQQQRVALARALVVRPRVLLLDEPLSNLDARLRQQMRSEIRRVCKAAGVTALYVTHDQQEALSTADRIAVLMDGRVAQVGTPRDLYERPADGRMASFLGEANLLPGTVADAATVDTAIGRLPADASGHGAGSPVTVCLRPERLRLDGTGTALATGVITEAVYNGAAARWRIRVGALELLVDEAAPPPRTVGDAVALHVRPGDAVVLPSAAASPVAPTVAPTVAPASAGTAGGLQSAVGAPL